MNNPAQRSAKASLLFTLLVGFSAGAAAAEVTLYEHDNFAGAQMTLRGYTPNFVNTGFNDRVSSLVVTSGTWELCTDAEFKGTCTTFVPGEYPTIDKRLNDRFSSAREIGSNGDRRGAYGDYGRGAIELFDRPEFAGRSIRLTSDAERLERSGFGDHAESLVVLQGTWQLCSAPEFGGSCRAYPPGRYSDLGYGMAGQVASARLLRSVSDAPVVVSAGHPPAPTRAGRAVLFSGRGLNGTSLAIAGPVPNLQSANFNDIAASLYIESGTWLACRDAYFRGDCRTFGPGRYDDLGSVDLDRAISSIRPAPDDAALLSPPPSRTGAPEPLTAPPGSPPPPNRPPIELFAEPGFGGERLALERDIGNLDRANFGGRAASIVIREGTWELCTEPRFSGNCAVFGPGRYSRLGGLTGQLFSVHRIR